jgi:hypothetical protein
LDAIGVAITAAMTTIKGIRDGKTWVIGNGGYPDWISTIPATTQQCTYVPIAPVPLPGSIVSPYGAGTPTDSYVGCNFLNLFGDNMYYTGNASGNGYTYYVPYVPTGISGDPVNSLDDDETNWATGCAGDPPDYPITSGYQAALTASLNLLRANYKIFPGYSCVMFTDDLTDYSDMSAWRTRVQIMNNDFKASMASNNADIGFSIGGNLSSLADPNFIVQQIATYFNFDPMTGKDLW